MSTDLTVMVTGESGTGKELVARALHDYGKRRKGPFVALNMAAIPRELIESELFGHERGAFTGAVQRSAGKFEQAAGGTLFLDEIGDMPPEAQTRLLRVLQEGEYTTVGGRTPIKANVRIVAATHRDLRRLIQQGLFREDLFYRLNVVPIRLPPLRERLDDIPELANHFLQAATADGLPAKVLSPEAMARLKQHRWPGNVRELDNLVRRLSALYSEEVIGVETIEAELADAMSAIEPEASLRRLRRCRRVAGRRRRPPSAGVVRRPRRSPAAGRHVRSCHFRGRAAAAVAGPWGDARESVARGPPLGAQSQYVAQEDQGPRRPRGTYAAGPPRRVNKVTAALGVSRLGDATAAVARRLGGRAAAVSLAVLAMMAGAATYAWLAGFVPAALSTRGWITGLLVADLVIAVALVALLAVRLTQLWLDRRRGAAGSRLHMRLVLVCSLFTITPTLIVAIILSLLCHQPHRLRREAGAGLVRGGARDRRAGAARARRGDPARHRRRSPLRCRRSASTPCATSEATTSLLDAPDRRPADHRGDRHRCRQGRAGARRGARRRRPIADPMPSAQCAVAGRQPGAPGRDPVAERRLLRHAALRRRAAVPGDRPCRRPARRRLHQEHRVRRLLLLADRAGHAAQPAPDLRRSAAPSRS